MLSWKKGPHKQDGIWGSHWYDNIYSSSKFIKKKNILSENYKKFATIYDEAQSYYKKLYNLIV